MTNIGIIMGSDSDLKVVQKATDLLDEFEMSYEAVIASAHRVPETVKEYAQTARERGLKVIIAAAGLAAHLPGVVASHTTLPVIGLPIENSALAGMDALYSIVQMPKGVPVATVGINNGGNAALLAMQILGTADQDVAGKLLDHKEKMREEVTLKNDKLQKFGIAGCMKTK